MVPGLDPGLIELHRPSRCSTALHRLVVSHVLRAGGRTLWIDARNDASTYTLAEQAPDARAVSNLRVARAFTAHQHHSLVCGDLLGELSTETSLVVAPCVASLYADDDVHETEARALLEATLATLAEVASVFEIPVLVSTGRAAGLDELVREYTTGEIECEATTHGYRYATGEFETLVYLQEGYRQTTIPYWVELLGVAGQVHDLDPVASDPRQLALAGV